MSVKSLLVIQKAKDGVVPSLIELKNFSIIKVARVSVAIFEL